MQLFWIEVCNGLGLICRLPTRWSGHDCDRAYTLTTWDQTEVSLEWARLYPKLSLVLSGLCSIQVKSGLYLNFLCRVFCNGFFQEWFWLLCRCLKKGFIFVMVTYFIAIYKYRYKYIYMWMYMYRKGIQYSFL